MHPASHGSIASLVPFGLPPHLIIPLCIGADIAAGLSLVAWIVLRVLSLRARRRALSRRSTFDVLPATSFDPKDEDVRRFARQLQRLGSSPGLFTPRRATGVRIRLHTGTSGRLTYRIEGPAAVGNLCLQSYPGVELRAVKPSPDGDRGTPEQEPENQTEPIQDGAPA